MVRLLLESGGDPNEGSPLFSACSRGDDRIVIILLEAGADPNLKNQEGKSPLWSASSQDRPQIVKLLLHFGALPDLQDKYGESLFFSAALRGQTELVALILKSGAEPNIKNKRGKSPLYCSSSRGHLDIVRLLLHGGADPNPRSEDEKSPVFVASLKGHTDIVRILLDFGGKIHSRTKTGKTGLYGAVYGGHQEIVTLLLQSGAEPNMKTNAGESALYVALERNGETKIIKSLLEAGADPDTRNSKGNTGLIIATKQNNIEQVKCFLDHDANIDLKRVSADSKLDQKIKRKSETAANGKGFEDVQRAIRRRKFYSEVKQNKNPNKDLINSLSELNAGPSTMEDLQFDVKKTDETALEIATRNGFRDIEIAIKAHKLYLQMKPKLDNDRLVSNMNDIVENLITNNYDFLQVFLNKKQVLERKDSSIFVQLFLDKDPEVINSLFWFIKDCLKKSEFKAGIECFLSRSNPFYGIQTTRLDNPEGNNENKTKTNTKSLLNFIINKESSVENYRIFLLKIIRVRR